MIKTAGNKKDIFYLLNKHSKDISKVESEMLLEYLFNCEKLDLYVKDLHVDRMVEELYDSLVSRRKNREPAQYITGRAEFMGREFIVTKDTLIPRPETEILVNEVLVSSLRSQVSGKAIDVCTGCGNIAISLAKSLPGWEITATDISGAALKIAEKNAAMHKAADRINFYKGDLFNALMFAKNMKFDIIVCNPPYVKNSDLPFLQEEVRFEPRIAVDGGEDGLDFYRAMAKEAGRYLKKGGRIFIEIGFGQAKGAAEIFSSYNIFKIDRIIKDFSGIERALAIIHG